jgi:hypothetical protein
MADVSSKQQTTALLLSSTVTRTRRHTELTKKTDEPGDKPVQCREHSVQFFVQFFAQLNCTVKLHSLTYSVWYHLDSQFSYL